MEENESTALTEKDFNDFLSATGKEQWKILLAHAERNKKIIQIRRLKVMEQNTNYEEISTQFEEFCNTKGIAAKFKVAFANMAENTRKQIAEAKHGAPQAAVPSYSAEELTREFNAFLKAKGLDGKYAVEVTDEK